MDVIPSGGRSQPSPKWFYSGAPAFCIIAGALWMMPLLSEQGAYPPWWTGGPLLVLGGAAVAAIPWRPRVVGPIAALLLLPAIWIVLEWGSLARYAGECGPDRLHNFWCRIREEGAAPGKPLSSEQIQSIHRKLLVSHSAWMTCPSTGAPYQWSSVESSPVPPGIAVWDGAPHGLLLKYRYGLTDDGEWKRFSESEVQSLLSAHPSSR
jgi:hypothetical protein